MTMLDKIGYWGYQIVRFVIDEPREANTEGGFSSYLLVPFSWF